ncbi:MAG TPA: isoprenyl transferase [Anaerolineae bacterium]|nr:isoprenyl transferase [Anaerolineae bacterium]HIQ09529.1 isoprenyl transferase [Anaerolineaceae bacterium]
MSDPEGRLPDAELKIPTHVAIIMDGNGRWARARGLPRLAGHRAGVDNLRRIIRACVEFGIQYLTIFAFSTENWARPKEEVDGLMNIMEEVIDQQLDELDAEGVQIRHVGKMEGVRPDLQAKIRAAVERTKHNRRLVLNVAFNYGGRDEIVQAIRKMICDGVRPDEVDEALVSRYLYTADCPDPDLVIRTSGEVRISNFLLWQSAYAEWYFTPVYWPDFDKEELRKALEDYSRRERRFGRVSEDETAPLDDGGTASDGPSS